MTFAIPALDNDTHGTLNGAVVHLRRTFPDMDFVRDPTTPEAEQVGATPDGYEYVIVRRAGLTDMRVVVTGKMQATRPVVEAWLRRHGATVMDAVDASTTHLITGDRVGSVKTKAAQRLGVTTITETDMIARCRQLGLTWLQ